MVYFFPKLSRSFVVPKPPDSQPRRREKRVVAVFFVWDSSFVSTFVIENEVRIGDEECLIPVVVS